MLHSQILEWLKGITALKKIIINLVQLIILNNPSEFHQLEQIR